MVMQSLERPQNPVVGSFSGNHIFLKLPPEQRHVWTPQLDLSLEPQPDGQTLVRGLIGPSPSVWTKFIFLYAVAGMLTLFGLITGVPQWMLGKPMVGIWVAGIGAIMAGFVFLSAKSGERMGLLQTQVLRDYWRQLVQEFEAAHPGKLEEESPSKS